MQKPVYKKKMQSSDFGVKCIKLLMLRMFHLGVGGGMGVGGWGGGGKKTGLELLILKGLIIIIINMTIYLGEFFRTFGHIIL